MRIGLTAKPVLYPQSLVASQEGAKILFPGIRVKEEGTTENQNGAEMQPLTLLAWLPLPAGQSLKISSSGSSVEAFCCDCICPFPASERLSLPLFSKV